MVVIRKGVEQVHKVEKYINYIDVNVTFNNAKMTNIYFAKNNKKEKDIKIYYKHSKRSKQQAP